MEREGYESHSWGVWRVFAGTQACRKLLKSEVVHALSHRNWPWVVCPLAEPSSLGSPEGVGSNLCLLMAWWQLLPLWSGLQWWYLVPVSGTPPGFEASAVASQLAFSLWDCKLQSHLVPPLALLLAWHTLVVGRHTFLWGHAAHSPCLPHLWHSRKWVPGICELGEWEVLAATNSCLSRRPRLFPGLPQLCCTSPSEYLHSSQPQFSPCGLSPEVLILSTQPLSCHGGCASCFLAGKCWLATSLWWILSVLPSKHPLLHYPWGSEAPPIPTRAGVSKCAETFPPSWLAPWVQVPVPNSFISFYLYLLPYLILRRLACLFGSLRSSASIQKVLCMSCFMCTCIFDTFVGRKVISPSSSSAILKVSHLRSYYSSWVIFVVYISLKIIDFMDIFTDITIDCIWYSFTILWNYFFSHSKCVWCVISLPCISMPFFPQFSSKKIDSVLWSKNQLMDKYITLSF